MLPGLRLYQQHLRSCPGQTAAGLLTHITEMKCMLEQAVQNPFPQVYNSCILVAVLAEVIFAAFSSSLESSSGLSPVSSQSLPSSAASADFEDKQNSFLIKSHFQPDAFGKGHSKRASAGFAVSPVAYFIIFKNNCPSYCCCLKYCQVLLIQPPKPSATNSG